MSDIKSSPVVGTTPQYDATAHTAAPPPTTQTPRPFRPLPPLDLPVLNTLRSQRTILASSSPRRRQLLAQIGLTNLEILPSNHPEDLPKSAYSTPWEYCVATAGAKAISTYQAALNDATKGDPAVVIAADTIVVGNSGEILEKPRSERQHIEMLKALRDGGRVGQGGPDYAMVEAAARQVESMGLGTGMRGEGNVRNVSAMGLSGKAGRTERGGWHKVYTAVSVCAPLESARDPGYAMETIVEETAVKFAGDISDADILAYVRTREGADKAGGYGIQGIGALLVERIEGNFDNVVGLPLRPTIKLIEKVLKIARDEGPEDGVGRGLGGYDEFDDDDDEADPLTGEDFEKI